MLPNYLEMIINDLDKLFKEKKVIAFNVVYFAKTTSWDIAVTMKNGKDNEETNGVFEHRQLSEALDRAIQFIYDH